MLSIRRSVFSFGSVTGTLELDMKVWSLNSLPVTDLVKDQTSFCPFFGLRLVINFSHADFLALMITLLFVASFFRQHFFFREGGGSLFCECSSCFFDMRVALFGPPWFYFFWGDAVGGFGHFEEAVTGFYHGIIE
jgi:hypothetical protein